MLESKGYMYRYPPDFKLSKKHRLASRIFKNFTQEASNEDCQCCEKRVGDQNMEPKSVFFDQIQLAFLGPGLPLFFCFLKNSIYVLFIFLLIFSSFCLYSNKITNTCLEKIQTLNCQDNFIDTFSILNKQNSAHSLEMQFLFMLTYSVMSFFISLFLRNQLKKLNQKCDFLTDTPSDYAIILRRLPGQVTQQDIRMLVEQVKQNLNPQQRQLTLDLQINHIVMSYSMQNYRLTKQKNEKQFRKAIKSESNKKFVPSQFEPFKQPGDVCIIVFEKQESKDFFKYTPTLHQQFLNCVWSPCVPLSNFQVKQQKVCIQRAPEPDDIIWQNSNIQIDQAIKRKTKFNILSVGLLLIGCGIQIPLAMAQQNVSQTAKSALGIVSSLVISLSNFGILQFLRYSSSKQKNLTHTEYNSVLMVKISCLQFLNAGIFLLISKFLASPSSFHFSNGLIFQINTIMVLNGVSHNVCVFILDYFEVKNKFYLYLGRKGIVKLTQIDANKLYQTPQPDMPYKYGYLLKTLWLTAFYSSFAPFCTFYSLFGLILNYLIEKVLFARTYSAPSMISSALTSYAVKLMQFFPLLMNFGGMVVFIYFSSEASGHSFVYFISSLVISLTMLLIPMEKITQKLFYQREEASLTSLKYNEIQNNFQTTYEMTNPAYGNSDRKRKRIVQNKKKRIRIGDWKQINLDLTQIKDNNYKGILQQAIFQFEEQNQKNRQVCQFIDKQRIQDQQEGKILYETIARTVIMKQEEEYAIFNKKPNQIKRKVRQMQVYNPLTSKQPNSQHKYSETYYKNFIFDKNRVKSIIGNPFSSRLKIRDALLANLDRQNFLEEAI